MEESARTRSRIPATVLVTLLIVAAEFAFLTWVYHLGDGLDDQRTTHARIDGLLTSLVADPDPATASDAGLAVQRLVDSGIDPAAGTRLTDRFDRWVSHPGDAAALAALRTEVASVDKAIGADERRLDLLAAIGSGAILVLISGGWFVWFRRLVRRHRAVEHALTEKQAFDAGERRLLALVENSADLIAVLEADSTVAFASPSTSTVLGVSPDDLLGARLVDLLPPEDAATLARHLVTPRDGDHGLQLTIEHGDGRTIILEGSLTNLTEDPAVNGWVLTVRDVTQRRELEDQLAHQAFHDSLTGLANRQLFADRLGHALSRRTTRPEPLTVLFCDLDDFKHVNDRRGHGVGDHLLIEVGARISRALRPGDTAARLGGDEFAVLVDGGDLEAARTIAARVQQFLGEPFLVDGTTMAVRASIGIAEALPGTSTGEELLRNADVAMYWAKDRGKSTVAVYESGLHARALERLELRGELQQGIRDDELVLHYQPTVDLATEEIAGFEALVRWQHPRRGLVPPNDFIPIAEQSGLIVPLGTWVLREACAAAAQLQSEHRQPSVAVNIAAQQVAETDFVDQVLGALRRAGLPPDRLVLEITETMLLDDMAGAIEQLANLRRLGVRVAIDDFGTGYSSLSYLSRLPVDMLKVDKSFVDQVCGGTHGASVTEAIIAMSRTMRLVTVAEGVEVAEQAAWLARASCTLGQGFLWSRPVELDVARELLASGLPHQHSRATRAATA